MDNLKLVGVGCFGKSETVARFFNKMARVYPIDMSMPSSLDAISGVRLGLEDDVMTLSLFSKSIPQTAGNESTDNFSLIFESQV